MKKTFTIITSLFLVMSSSVLSLNALEVSKTNDANQSQQLNYYYDENDNYENPMTGEYFRWTAGKTKSEIGKFEFKIKASVTSSIRFKPDASRILIEVRNVRFETYEGLPTTCCSNHRFTVDFKKNGLSTNLAYFKAPVKYDAYSLGGGFSTSSSYAVKITNTDGLSGNKYLVGSGNVYAH